MTEILPENCQHENVVWGKCEMCNREVLATLYDEPYAKPKYKLVDLDVLRRIHPIRDIANGIYSSRSYEVDGYNRAIDDIKSKYGDLYTMEGIEK